MRLFDEHLFPNLFQDPRGSARHDPKGAQDRESGGNDQQIYHQRGEEIK